MATFSLCKTGIAKYTKIITDELVRDDQVFLNFLIFLHSCNSLIADSTLDSFIFNGSILSSDHKYRAFRYFSLKFVDDEIFPLKYS